MADPLFSYECEADDCGCTFDLRGVRQDVIRCVVCGMKATHIYTPGSWTHHGSGILPSYYDPSIQGVVSGYRQLEQRAKERGLNLIEERRYSKLVKQGPMAPTELEVEKAFYDLKDEDVRRHEDGRLKSSWETRNGIHDHTRPEPSRFHKGEKTSLIASEDESLLD